MKLFTAIATLLLATVVAAQPSWSDCSGGYGEFTVASISVPNPFCAGQNVCITIYGSLWTPITAGANLKMVNKYLNRIVNIDTVDLCAVAAESGFPCPIPTTLTTINICILVKPTIPVNVSEISFIPFECGDNGCQGGVLQSRTERRRQRLTGHLLTTCVSLNFIMIHA